VVRRDPGTRYRLEEIPRGGEAAEAVVMREERKKGEHRAAGNTADVVLRGEFSGSQAASRVKIAARSGYLWE
jgi:hypothetical protein